VERAATIAAAMGQPVAVVETQSSQKGIVRFEANRNLTGMGHERYESLADAVGTKPSAVLARRFFETGSVDAVHVYLNVVTVDVRKGHSAEGLGEVLENLYIYYTPGFVPPPLVLPEEAAPAPGDPAADAPGTPGLSAAASRVPAHLLERSKAAKEKWFAKQG
jgi:hypothetical protein